MFHWILELVHKICLATKPFDPHTCAHMYTSIGWTRARASNVCVQTGYRMSHVNQL